MTEESQEFQPDDQVSVEEVAADGVPVREVEAALCHECFDKRHPQENMPAPPRHRAAGLVTHAGRCQVVGLLVVFATQSRKLDQKPCERMLRPVQSCPAPQRGAVTLLSGPDLARLWRAISLPVCGQLLG